MNRNEKEWMNEFKEFVDTEETSVPKDVSNRVVSYVHRSLNPPAYFIFLKLLGVHAIFGTLSLAICDQFGMSPFQTQFSLSDYFMRFGHSTCMLLCGIQFVGLSALVSAYLLRPEELRVLKKSEFAQVLGLAVVSLLGFLVSGAEVAFSIAMFWLVGALVGGISSIEAAFRLRLPSTQSR